MAEITSAKAMARTVRVSPRKTRLVLILSVVRTLLMQSQS